MWWGPIMRKIAGSSGFAFSHDHISLRRILLHSNMADPISIAGLAIAVFDKILLVGSKTAEIISDYRHFDDVRPPGCTRQHLTHD
jgi:hypothetical protein